MNFWQKLKKPFTVLAPMEDVTDMVFRQILIEAGRPDVFFTEFTNVEGAAHAVNNSPLRPSLNLREGTNPVLQRLIFSETEHPIVAQIWGKDPKNFYEVAKLIKKLKFDGVDINMGCPQRDVIKNGCCVALIDNRSLATEIIVATKEGSGKLPVSVKTRIGLNKIVTEDWCGFLLEQKLEALTVHGRTAKEMSDVPAHWDEIAKVVKMRNQVFPKTIIIGNGDIKNVLDAKRYALNAGVDGVMIGRGVFENPWCFSDHLPTKKEKLDLLKKHLELWEKTWGDKKNFSVLKKYFKIYIRDFDGAGELRAKLMETKSLEELKILTQKFL